MASLHLDKRTGNWIVMFRWGGKQYRKSTGVTSQSQAKEVKSRIEELIRLLKRGRVELPSDADPGTWIFTDGKVLSHQVPEQQPPEAPALSGIGEICDAYLKEQHGKAESTLVGEKAHIKHLRELLGQSTRLDSLRNADLQRYITKRLKCKYRNRPISGKTIRKELVTFRQLWDWARQRGLVDRECPVYGDHGGRRWMVSIPKEEEKRVFQTWQQIETRIQRGGLSAEQQKSLWDSLFLDADQLNELLSHVQATARHSFIHPMFAFAVYTGARRGEVIRSLIDDIDFTNGQITLRERKRRKDRAQTFRFVPLHSRLRDILGAWFEEHPGGQHCFAAPMEMEKRRSKTSLAPLTTHAAHHHFKQTLKESKWSVLRGFHVLRHSFGSNLARSGQVPRETIARWMGHTTQEMMALYQHVFPQDGHSQIETLK